MSTGKSRELFLNFLHFVQAPHQFCQGALDDRGVLFWSMRRFSGSGGSNEAFAESDRVKSFLEALIFSYFLSLYVNARGSFYVGQCLLERSPTEASVDHATVCWEW